MNRASLRRGFRLHAGPLAAAIEAASTRAARAADGLWWHDPTTWSTHADVQAKIANRLGWLKSPTLMKDSIGRIKGAAESIRHAGFEDVVLLGMGGSSLAPEVLRAVIGTTPGWPRLHMLDSTDPAAVRAVATTPARTLYLLASKSGTTIEPNSLAAHFRTVLEDAGVAWASHFIAITDPDTALAEKAKHDGFRDVFINPADIGGRYSALSFFGLVPSALMGQDIDAILGWAHAMLEEAQSDIPLHENGAIALGALMGAGAKAGRDKLTLVVPSSLEPFGLWVEQLVAESTGKQGVGVVPIAGETFGAPGVYGHDRLFVRLRAEHDPDEVRRDEGFAALSAWPSATIAFADATALGAEFMRWEIATAVAGAILEINPFDEPNVQQAKDATKKLLDAHASQGRFPSTHVDHQSHGAGYTLTTAARSPLHGRGAAEFLTLLGEGDYLALLAYLGPDPDLADALHRFRMSVRDRAKTATMIGYGPRYLHSTGQLHKGGPNNGVFLIVTTNATEDLPIPDQPFSFATLETAQALGDFASLEATGRRGLHLHIPTPDARALDAALRPLLDHLPRD